MLKKFSLIIIIIVLAYSQVGYYFVMRHTQLEQKKAIKERMISQLKDEELEVISSGNKNIYWEEEGKEFLFNDEMYDIVKTKMINGKVILYCINDKKEKTLIDNYNLITKNNSSSDKKGKAAFDNFFNLFVDVKENHSGLNFSFISKIFHSFDSRLSENAAEQISPPPKA